MAKRRFVLNKIDLALLVVLTMVAVVFRLYKISAPLTDHHSWRQADTAAVARNYARDGIDLLYPRYDDLSNIQSGTDNPEGYRFVEFPLYNAAIASVYRLFPALPLVLYGRLITIFFSLILLIVLYYLVLKEEGRLAAFFATSVFAFFPFFVFYSRAVLPDMTALSLAFLSILLLYLFTKANSKTSTVRQILLFLFSGIFFSLSLLIKPTTVFFFIPILYIFFRKYRFSFLKKLHFYIYLVLALVPTVLWRMWIAQFPEGIPFYSWLLYQVNTPQGLQVIFFRPAYFRWIFKERILNLILGGYMIVFTIIGALKKPLASFLFIFVGLASLAYLFTFQGGNVQHDYYQIMILPVLAIFSGLGISFFLTKKGLFFSSFLNWAAVLIIIALSFGFSYFHIKDFYSHNQNLVNIANIISTVTDPQDRIVTDTTGDTTLLYLSDRRGYPAPTKDFDSLKRDGMDYFVTAKPEVAESLRDRFDVIFENDKVYIFKL